MAKVITPKKTRSNSLSEVQNLLDVTKSEILHELRQIKEALVGLESKIKNVETTLSEVLNTQKRQDTELKIVKGDVLFLKENQEKIFSEFEDRERRRTNLIISGLPECTQGPVEERKRWDAQKVDALFKELTNLNCDAVDAVHRIGKTNSSSPRLMRVICRDTSTKLTLLRKAKDLRRLPEYRNVFVNPDYTPFQQREQRLLREELRLRKSSGENVFIHRGKIVTRNFS